jgi:preprotein translocase subunit Sec63
VRIKTVLVDDWLTPATVGRQDMALPLMIDPYAVLSVAKDVDLSTICSSHRKLVLKVHSDKIKDEADRAITEDEFHKVLIGFAYHSSQF